MGIGVAGYAYTGDRAYEFTFIFVALLGFLMVLAGSVLTGVGQANRPRMGGRAARKKDEEDDKEPLSTRLKTGLAGLTTRLASSEEDEAEEEAPEPPADDDTVTATLRCARCSHVFEAAGEPPFEAECPDCGNQAQVELPTEDREGKARPAEPRGSPRSQPEPDEAPLPDATGPDAQGDVSVQLSCQSCHHVFVARGDVPFEVACPECQHRGRVAGLPD